MQADDAAFAIHQARVPILILHHDMDVIPVENVLFYFKRAPEPKQMVVLSGLHTTTYIGGKHIEEATNMAIDWFNSWQRKVPIVHGGKERVQISSPKIIL